MYIDNNATKTIVLGEYSQFVLKVGSDDQSLGLSYFSLLHSSSVVP